MKDIIELTSSMRDKAVQEWCLDKQAQQKDLHGAKIFASGCLLGAGFWALVLLLMSVLSGCSAAITLDVPTWSGDMHQRDYESIPSMLADREGER